MADPSFERTSVLARLNARSNLTVLLTAVMLAFGVGMVSCNLYDDPASEPEAAHSFDEAVIPAGQMWQTSRPVSVEIVVEPSLYDAEDLAYLEIADPRNEAVIYRGRLPQDGRVAVDLAVAIHVDELLLELHVGDETMQALAEVASDRTAQHAFEAGSEQ